MERVYAITQLLPGYPRNPVDGRKYFVSDVHFRRRAAAESAAKRLKKSDPGTVYIVLDREQLENIGYFGRPEKGVCCVGAR